MNKEVSSWIRDIDEAYIEGWANRGLLRRGRKLFEGLQPEDCTLNETGAEAGIEGHKQCLTAPGFENLVCSCPAPGACHHLIAFLLGLSEQVEANVSLDTASDTDSTPPWLEEDFAPIEKQLGKAWVKRAQRLLLQSVDVDLVESKTGLVANITASAQHTVRIPRSVGLDASLCSCNAERCAHRALAVLKAREQAGLYQPDEAMDEALEPDQIEVVNQLQQWLRDLAARGTVGVSRAMVERGEALATVTRQADFPLLASNISGLVKLQQDELAGRSFLSTADFRIRLAPLWTRLKALQSTPLPQPLSKLAGDHKRYYKLVQNLELIGVAAEAWRSQTNYLGLTLHLYAPKTGEWYRHAQVRAADQAQVLNWSPEQCFKQMSWAGGVAYKQVPGMSILLQKGWVSGDGALSGREGTTLSGAAMEAGQIVLPIESSFQAIGERYAQAAIIDPVAPLPFLPALVEVAQSQKPQFDNIEQRWCQTIEDQNGNTMRLQIGIQDAYSIKARNETDKLLRSKKKVQLVFGFVAYLDGSLTLRPVSIKCKGEGAWIHLSL